MTYRARHCIRLALLVCGLLVAGAPRAEAQPRVPGIRPHESQAFRLILDKSGLKPLKEITDLRENPSKTWLIVFGELETLQEIDKDLDGGLEGFVGNGGAILVASDRRESEDLVRALFGVVPNGTEVANRDPIQTFGGHPLFPFVTSFPLPNHPLFRRVKQLATNTPTFLERRESESGLHDLARFPEGCVDDRTKEPLRSPLFAVGNDSPSGTKLFLAGHGVFMNNEMVNRDNILFARNCVDWFTRSPDGKKILRERVLFIEEGRIRTHFDVALRQLPAPPLPPVDKLNRIINGLDKENLPNKVLLNALGPPGVPDREERIAIGRERLLRWLGIMLGLLVILYLVRWLWRGRYQRETAVPLVESTSARPVPPVGMVELRERGMLFDGNLWEAARELARQCFTEYVDPILIHPPPQPQVAVQGNLWRRRALTKKVQLLWDLAYAGPAKPISPVQFRRLLAEVDDVKAALAAGTLRLQEPVRPTRPQPAALPGQGKGSQSPAVS